MNKFKVGDKVKIVYSKQYHPDVYKYINEVGTITEILYGNYYKIDIGSEFYEWQPHMLKAATCWERIEI